MASAGPLTKLVRWFGFYEEDDMEYDEPDTTTPPRAHGTPAKSRRGPLVLPERDAVAMQIRHPRTLDDRMLVGMDLKQRRTVTLDLTRLPDADARYFFEFVLGVVYALDATAEKVTEGIYLLIPRGVSFSNDVEHPAEEAAAPAAPAARAASRPPRAAASRGDGQEELFWHGG
ncbi:MAG TPA: cell division protein SepF [Armatimonadota bacterium]|nr:cell division protein SepF [Armatimonadota bacterium]